MESPGLRIRERADQAATRARFGETGRSSARGLLEPDAAEALLARIEGHADWRLTYNDGSDAYEATQTELEAAGPAQRDALMAQINRRAQTQFQYVFEHVAVSEMVRRGEDAGALAVLHDWLNGRAFLDLFQSLTGIDAGPGAHLDVYVTRYGPGCFLLDHDDRFDKADRRAAYVINLTKGWSRNWGGHLAFFDERGDIEQALVPTFNDLNFFAVPQPHAVLPVAPFAGGRRISISGWLRGDGPV